MKPCDEMIVPHSQDGLGILRRGLWPIWAGGLLLLLAGCSVQVSGDVPPNVIILFADDLGYEDVGVYGAGAYRTPNLDRLAREGMRFTSFYVAANSCTPSRAALLTGRYPVRVGLPRVLGPRSTIGLDPEEITLAEVLKAEGYATAAVGKWHLGDHPKFLPTNHGFDAYFGLPYSNDMSPDPRNNPRERARRHPPLPLIRDTTIIEREPDQSQLTRRYTEEAIRFIEQNEEQPFFVYLAYNAPHVPLYASERFRGMTEQGLYGDVIREIDWSVGRVLETLDRLGLERETLVIFTSDNGPWLIFGDHAGSTGPLRGSKGTTFDGGQRVPMIARWPGRIPAGTVTDEMVTAMDVVPTIARLVGAELPAGHLLDGYDIWPILAGEQGAESSYEKFFFFKGEELQAVRSGTWKLHVPHSYRYPAEVGQGGMPGAYGHDSIGVALFNLEEDVSEMNNEADEHPEVVRRLKGYIEEGRQISPGSPGRVEAPWAKQINVKMSR